jgi:hypothetical protein
MALLNPLTVTATYIIMFVSFGVFGLYLWPISALGFKKSQALSTNDFSLTTDEFRSWKFAAVSWLPLFLFLFMPFTLALRLSMVKQSSEKTNTDNDEKRLHIVMSIIVLVLVVISFIYLCIDAANCNLPGPNGAFSLCTNIRYCCAKNILTSPGFVDGCPYVFSCETSIQVDNAQTQLPWDTYFAWAFIMAIILILISVINIAFGFLAQFYETDLSETQGYNENELVSSNINGVARKFGSAQIPSAFSGQRANTTGGATRISNKFMLRTNKQ